MTIQQLKYVVTVAERGTITGAADRLYISQPSLTNAIHELEKEMNIQIFNRTNKGISLSKEGEDFLGYARQVLEQAAILEDNVSVVERIATRELEIEERHRKILEEIEEMRICH